MINYCNWRQGQKLIAFLSTLNKSLPWLNFPLKHVCVNTCFARRSFHVMFAYFKGQFCEYEFTSGGIAFCIYVPSRSCLQANCIVLSYAHEVIGLRQLLYMVPLFLDINYIYSPLLEFTQWLGMLLSAFQVSWKQCSEQSRYAR